MVLRSLPDAGRLHTTYHAAPPSKRPCSKNKNWPPGRTTRASPRTASATPGMVHRVNVLTMVSTLASGSGIFSPGRSRNSTSSLVSLRCFSGALEHSGIGFERVQFFDFGGIVKREVDARAYADFKDRPLRVRNDWPADFEDGLGIAEGRDDVGIDAVAIKGHAGLGLLRKYRAAKNRSNPERFLPGRSEQATSAQRKQASCRG
jgi:hypothetical protein